MNGTATRPVRWRLRILGVVSAAIFFMPLVAPFVQGLTLYETLSAAWRGRSDSLSVAIGAAGAALGFVLFLATQVLWVI